MQQDHKCWLGGVQAIALNLQDVTCCLACSHRQRPALRLPHLKQSRKLKSVMIVNFGALMHRIETATAYGSSHSQFRYQGHARATQ